jgi:hypothetical protein
LADEKAKNKIGDGGGPNNGEVDASSKYIRDSLDSMPKKKKKWRLW